MTHRTSVVAFLFGTAVALGVAPETRVEAQDVGAAETIFDKGVADMEAGRFDAGCPEIAESLRLDPRPGTLFTLAECYAKAGKTASAVARYTDYLDQYAKMSPEQRAKQNDRAQVSQSQVAKLTPQVPMLTLRLSRAPSGTEVKRDGTILGDASLGVALPLDPGQHVVSAQPPGGSVVAQTLTIGPSERKDVTLDVGQSGRAGGAQRIAGFVVGGVGVAGILVGAITGGVTLAKKSTLESTCNFATKQCTDDQSLSSVKSAHAVGVASTVSFIVGGVLVGTGIIVVVTAPRAAGGANVRVGVSGAPGTGAISLSGSF